MKNLRDIEVKKGDKVYFTNGHLETVSGWKDFYKNYRELNNDIKDTLSYGKIIKIERPVKYETIYEEPKQILDKEEKEYLEAVLRPYKHQVIEICKKWAGLNQEYIKIDYDNGKVYASFQLPYFKQNTMYKDMELNKNYTLKELKLFTKGE